MEKPEAKPAAKPPAAAAAAKPAAAAAGPAAPKAPPPPKLEDVLRKPVPSAAIDALRAAMPEAVEEVTYHAGEASVRVPLDRLRAAMLFLRDDPRCLMNLFGDLTALDFPKDAKRFEVNYHLYSIPLNQRLRVKVRAAEGESVPSVTGLWATANWHEREAFDLLGIPFADHPDLTRILLPDDWRGHPLRKEYPLEGYPDQHPRYR